MAAGGAIPRRCTTSGRVAEQVGGKHIAVVEMVTMKADISFSSVTMDWVIAARKPEESWSCSLCSGDNTTYVLRLDYLLLWDFF